jgi:SAM-dependent methyltransferase
VRPYDALAGCYDQFFPRPRALWRRARKALLRRLPIRVTSLCDLACGTGNTALEFARRGVRVFALDGSAAMCRILRRKARKLRVPLRVIRADMRTCRLPQPVDLVTCEFHALNHLLRESDLRRMLRCVHRMLRPGGFFFFDCGHQAMYVAAPARHTFLDSGEMFLVRGYHFDAARKRAQFEATWFVRKGARWQRFDERIPQVPWSDARLRALLRQEGFALEAARDAAHYLPAGEARRASGCVTFYLTRKQ